MAGYSAQIEDFAVARCKHGWTLDNSFSADGKVTTDFAIGS
ncbi:MAG: hypothetical protein IPH05_18880 [Flavobacteriales bacterium]|nr:hypothetical protein [Flavobacteriales bacterium]